MWEVLASIENSGFSTWISETPSVLGYPTILAFHAFGLAFLVGLSSMIALRILGVAPRLPLAPLEGLFPLIWVGFWVNAVSGLVLLALTPTAFFTHAAFWLKLAAIAGAMVSIQSLRTNVFHGPSSPVGVPMKGKVLAGTMLTFWLAAITSGRVTAYPGYVGRQTAAVVVILAVGLLVAWHVTTRLKPSRSARRAPVTP